MPTSIDWTDAIGSASLTNSKNFPGDRLANWTPRSVPFGSSVNTLAGDLIVWEDREDHSAAFDLVGIPYSSLGLMLRLQSHLSSGGTVQVTTGDRDDTVYPECCLAENAEVTIELTDKVTVEYTMSMTLLNLETEQMVAFY